MKLRDSLTICSDEAVLIETLIHELSKEHYILRLLDGPHVASIANMTQKYSNLANCKFIKLITDALSRDNRKTQRYNKISHTQEIDEAEACTRNQQKQKNKIFGTNHRSPAPPSGLTPRGCFCGGKIIDRWFTKQYVHSRPKLKRLKQFPAFP
ncbi:hypothetical protein AVEN_187132-1 [Araneus ventricosus]|uniref:Uncharacterized protein n=1 Tax=Araneus ventricosus TaxID=182803 RepID=A0A4Y1ZP78_ARAVE|nr:hypothetical protein AVEN_187132-1 [Araneus ventricosus]